MTATITVHGGLTAPPEIRYSQSGVAIAGGTVASTDRYMDRESNEWRDGKKLFLRWSAFKDLAENIGASALDKGAQVTLTGKLITREFQDREGNNRSSTELEVTDFSVSLKRATAQVTRAASGSRQPVAAGSAPAQSASGPAVDAWAAASPGSFGDDTPF